MNAFQGLLDPYCRELVAMGFTRNDDGKAYRLRGHLLDAQGHWATLRSNGIRDADNQGQSDFGQPGLWKSLPASRADRISHIFELPLALLGEDEFSRRGEPELFRDCLEWAMATGAGRLPGSWSAPPRNEIDAILPPEELIVRTGATVRQSSLILEDTRVALRCPILPVIPDDLSPGRRQWLETLLREGQARWRMVRVGTLEDTSAQAEVDISGAPLAVLEPLLRIALDALGHVVRWLSPSAEFLIDTQRECRALELCLPRQAPLHP